MHGAFTFVAPDQERMNEFGKLQTVQSKMRLGGNIKNFKVLRFEMLIQLFVKLSHGQTLVEN